MRVAAGVREAMAGCDGVVHLAAVSQLVWALLGWQPRVTLHDGLRRLVAAHRAAGRL